MGLIVRKRHEMVAAYSLSIWLASVFGATASAGDVGKLKLPVDEALLKQIAELPGNTWMKLPPVKTAGDLSWLSPKSDYRRQGPRIRDYCNKMVWAPERERALYCGAGHNIHLYNDVWEYDLASNTWICLYAPDPTPGVALFLLYRNGWPIRQAIRHPIFRTIR